MPPHPLTNFEIKKYYQNDPRFNGVYSTENPPKRTSTESNLVEIKDEAYIINLDSYSDIGAHCIAFYIQNNDVTYFDSFGEEYIPKETKTCITNKNIKTKIFRTKAYDLIMCRYFFGIRFINFMLAGKTLTEFTN